MIGRWTQAELPFGSSRQKRSAGRFPLLGLTLALAVVLAGCSSGKKESVKPSDVSPKTTLPDACKGITDPSKTESLPRDCANAIFLLQVRKDGSAELKKLDDGKLIALGSASCSFAAVVKADGELSTPFEDIVASNAENWGISEQSVVQVMTASATLCPNDIASLLRLRDSSGAIPVDYVAIGPGMLEVTYTGVDGNPVTSTVPTPWEYRVMLQTIGSVSISVKMADDAAGDPKCQILVKRKELSAAKAKKGVASCSAGEQQLLAAAN